MRCEGVRTYSQSGTCPVCKMYLQKEGAENGENQPLSLRDYRIDLVTTPQEPLVGIPTTLQFSPHYTKDGTIIKELETVHGAELEVYVTTQDLKELSRKRPLRNPDGNFTLVYTFKHSGNHLLYVVTAPKEKPTQIFPLAVQVKGEKENPRTIRANSSPKKTRSNYLVKINTNEKIQSGKQILLKFHLSYPPKKRASSDDVVVKEFAYITAISEDTTRFIQAHTAVKEKGKGIWESEAMIKFPKPGLYKVFGEFLNSGEVVDYTLQVK